MHSIFSEPQASQRDSVKETTEPIPTYSAEEERQDSKLWRTVIIGEQEHRINMKSIEPYQKVISHGGTLKKYFKECMYSILTMEVSRVLKVQM